MEKGGMLKMWTKKKIVALATVVAMVAVVVGVYALRVSNVLEAYWSVYEPQDNLVLEWVKAPPSPIPKGEWIDIIIKLKNVGDATYNVRVYFKIWTDGPGIPADSIQVLYWENTQGKWLPLPMSGWGSSQLQGWYGPAEGFPVSPGYNVDSQFWVLFDGNAPICSYGFNAWVEQV